ncbi:MAG: exodeoxyribonuclease VII small subunit [Deferribacterales bacterium]|jgi:exodeoxyribonuclease VII small subunit|uniref:exodeoxyribonuclease VII small subunit n=1 Tax=Deferrivibrio essentukiensis TaxID=2880922 RepID=UPI00199101B4|nr:exodeoxyribonuclease VII small subunit [Deferrivibrio essentukiensis]MBC7196652.1 exodeoxyribonuclease VII small subunit [Deferribacterales bacterium]MBZ4672671.1 xseB [Deferribacteraceae bacterium]MCB4204443.1 exodeoxyribonuclease VII small subunit [Deferrivibrio essentukiensis]
MKDNNKFEAKLKRLEEIAEKLERQDIGIEESLSLFQEGMKLGKECKKILEEVELKVQKVVNEIDDEIKTEPFDE